jgi:hypothetical protein
MEINIKPIILSEIGKCAESIRQTKPAEFGKVHFNSQNERLKDYYESKGVPFLLPHQQYSDKRIADAVELLGKNIDNLIKNKKLNKKTAQKALEKITPEAKGKIKIKDFVDFENDRRTRGMSEDRIKLYLKFGAVTVTNLDEKTSTIYVNFKKAKEGVYGPILFKREMQHEVKHALTYNLQNTIFIDMYKNDRYKVNKQNGVFNKIFAQFERFYNPNSELRQTELTQKNMLSEFGFNSTNDLNKSFDNNLNKLIEDTKTTGELNIDNDKKGWKQFFNTLKEFAKGEKNAYQSEKVLREVYHSNTPTNAEFTSMLYAEMEKFFNKKRIES